VNKKTSEENLKQTIEAFWETVPGVWGIIRSNLREMAAVQFDISVEQFHVLRHIRKGLTSVKDIAEARQISRPAISQAADLLVEKGLITRREAAGDRRFVCLALTPAGEELLNQLFRQNRLWMMEKMASLSEEDLLLIIQGLRCLKSAFQPQSEPKQEQNPTLPVKP
jgi:DNA-binding MarR family transcriptional regulator